MLIYYAFYGRNALEIFSIKLEMIEAIFEVNFRHVGLWEFMWKFSNNLKLNFWGVVSSINYVKGLGKSEEVWEFVTIYWFTFTKPLKFRDDSGWSFSKIIQNLGQTNGWERCSTSNFPPSVHKPCHKQSSFNFLLF